MYKFIGLSRGEYPSEIGIFGRSVYVRLSSLSPYRRVEVRLRWWGPGNHDARFNRRRDGYLGDTSPREERKMDPFARGNGKVADSANEESRQTVSPFSAHSSVVEQLLPLVSAEEILLFLFSSPPHGYRELPQIIMPLGVCRSWQIRETRGDPCPCFAENNIKPAMKANRPFWENVSPLLLIFYYLILRRRRCWFVVCGTHHSVYLECGQNIDSVLKCSFITRGSSPRFFTRNWYFLSFLFLSNFLSPHLAPLRRYTYMYLSVYKCWNKSNSDSMQRHSGSRGCAVSTTLAQLS